MSARSSLARFVSFDRPRRLLRTAAIATSLVLAGFGQAATVSWDGGGDGVSWSDPLNWSGDALPGAADAVVVSGSFAGTTIVHGGGSTAIASFDGYRLAISGGSFAVSGSCLVRARLEYSGGTLLATTSLHNATLVGAGGTSPVTFVASGSSAFEGTLRSGQTLWVQGGGFGTSATLSWTAGSINDGTIVMETVSSSYSCSLQIANDSSLLNRGTLSVRPGTFGSRYVYGTLVNEGTLEVLADIGLYHGGNLVNEGVVDVRADAWLTLSNSFEHSVTQSAGSIGGEGSVVVNAGLFTITGGAIDREITVRNVQIDVGPGVAGNALIVAQASCGLTNNLSPTTTIWVQGGGAGVSATLTTSPGTVNEGTILMETVSSSYSCSLQIANDSSLLNRGTLSIRPGTLGNRYVYGTLVNEGTLEVLADIGLYHGGNLVNEGVVDVALGGSITLSNSYQSSVTQTAGSIGGEGSVLVNAGLFTITGGAIDREITVRNVQIDVGAGVSGDGWIVAQASCGLTNNLSPTTTLWVQGGGAGQSATLTMSPDTVNEGTIVMETVSSSYSCSLQIANDSSLLNRGTISVRPGTFGNRYVYGTLVNEGTVVVHPGIGLYHGGNLVNEGGFDVHADAWLTLSNSFEHSVTLTAGSIGGEGSVLVNAGLLTITGGAIDREITVRNVQINVGAEVSGDGWIIAQASCGLTNNLSPTTTIWVQGGGAGSSATLTTSPEAINDGTILLESVSSSYTSAVSVPPSTLFVNRGLLKAATGTAGPRSITGGGTLRNEGVLAPSVHTPLVVSGPFEQTAGGVFRVQFDGTTAGTWARLQCSSVASLAGSLEVVRGSKFAPEPGASFTCLTASSIAGAFDSAGGCGVAVELVQTDTTVSCVFGPIDCVADLNLDGLVNGADLTILLSGWGPCDVPAVCPGDLNCDGSVTGADLATLLAAWGVCP